MTGEGHSLETIKNAYQFLQNTQCYATGGFGPEEQFIVQDGMPFHGNWSEDGIYHYAEKPGSSFEGKFKGSVLVWEGLRKNDAGIAKVIIDGKEVAEVDQYGYTDVHVGRFDQREVPFRWSMTGLGGGEQLR